MKYVISRYNHDLNWLADYSMDYVLFDRSEKPLENSIVVPNIGSDIWDKLGFIIDNYRNLPEVAVYTKANLFKYITREEWDKICNNQTFTPILTQNHKTYSDDRGVVCFYKDGIYWERNDYWYLGYHAVKGTNIIEPLTELLGIWNMKYVPFAPGSNYILPKENILKHPKDFYEKLRSYIDWAVYPGECMIIERGLYTLWK